MCNPNEYPFNVEIESNELTKRVKLKKVRAYVEKLGKEMILAQPSHLVVKSFKSEQGVAQVKGVIMEILDDMCENLNSDQQMSCEEMFNCCDCGTGECGCPYCWSCHACYVCMERD